MQNDNNHPGSKSREISLSVRPGVVVIVSAEVCSDYLEMKAAQLSALNHLLTGGDFDAWNETIKADAHWLAASLAEEVSQLVQSVTFGENLG
ncbi:hypothetical protein GTP38_23220 [Duganella sp. FT94W]|uniref:Uncharacterized protein n=1 Tax=Duganella lactea TaxID=2692173 RepID=A0ABW9VCE6_9BURK|nr:hypothetical protein [Duganella lactea]MYM37241.1 hypothetical protein [Duganella lactea]